MWKKRVIVLTSTAVAVLFIATVVLAILLKGSDNLKENSNGEVSWPEVGNISVGVFSSAVVVSPMKLCSSIGKQLLLDGGSAVDAAIGTCLCLGVIRPTSCGIGGGSFLNYYNRTSKTAHTLDFQETAPRYSHKDMFVNSSLSSLLGGAAVAVPGEIAGYWVAHQKYGRLPWQRIFQPSINLCENGFRMADTVKELGNFYWQSLSSPMKDHLTNPSTNSIYNVGENMTWKSLGATLRVIAKEGAQAFYNGSLTAAILQDLRDCGSNITAEDLLAYRVEERTPVVSTLRNGNVTLYSLPPPSSGLVVQYILNILDGFNFSKESMSTNVKDISKVVITLHSIVESMKFGYGQRMKLGDEKFVDVKEFIKNLTDSGWSSETRRKIADVAQNVSYYGSADPKPSSGTCHISVIDANGDAVALTSTINTSFGSKQLGSRTGILFNNEMDDFSSPGQDNTYGLPPSATNFIEAGKRPMSSMSPTVVVDEAGDVRMVTGSVGGSRIIAGIVRTIINEIWFGLSPSQSNARPRLYHQLNPDVLRHESGFPKEYTDGLAARKHKMESISSFPESSFSTYRGQGQVYGVADPRVIEAGADGF